MKVLFSNNPESQQIEAEILAIMTDIERVSLRLLNVSHRVPFADTKGRLQGYADVIRDTGGNISELFEFYK